MNLIFDLFIIIVVVLITQDIIGDNTRYDFYDAVYTNEIYSDINETKKTKKYRKWVFDKELKEEK